jgi:xylono-1,5-lactonase
LSALRNVYAASNQLGEAAIWHAASQRLLWVDLYDPKLFIHDPVANTTEVRVIALKGPLGAIAATTNPALLVVTHLEGISTINIETGDTKPFAKPEQGRDALIYNDCKVDRFGRLWVGTSHDREVEARGALWCVLPNGECFLVDAGFAVSNGPAFSLDGKTMYFNDSVGRKTFVYDISASDPHPRNRRALISYTEEEGMPDGLTVDADDCLWVAHWGGARITRFSPKGERSHAINIPAPQVTTVGFGGVDYKTLFITTARDGLSDAVLARWPQSGDLFAIEPDVAGVPEPLFPITRMVHIGEIDSSNSLV